MGNRENNKHSRIQMEATKLSIDLTTLVARNSFLGEGGSSWRPWQKSPFWCFQSCIGTVGEPFPCVIEARNQEGIQPSHDNCHDGGIRFIHDMGEEGGVVMRQGTIKEPLVMQECNMSMSPSLTTVMERYRRTWPPSSFSDHRPMRSIWCSKAVSHRATTTPNVPKGHLARCEDDVEASWGSTRSGLPRHTVVQKWALAVGPERSFVTIWQRHR